MNEQVDNALGGHGFATVTSTQVGAVSDIAKRLRIKADMIHIGERIQWGSETALMYEAADYIDAVGGLYNKPPETLQYTRDELVELLSKAEAERSAGDWQRLTRLQNMENHVDTLLATGQLKVRDEK